MDAHHSIGERLHRPLERLVPNPKLKFLEQCREALRFHRLELRTEESYLQWIKQFIFFHNKRHPKAMGEEEVKAFMTHLAADRLVAASTQNQALGGCCSCIKRRWGGNWGFWRVLPGLNGGRKCPWY